MTAVEKGTWLTYVVFVGQFVLVGWALGPGPVALLRRGVIALGWTVPRSSVPGYRRLAGMTAAAAGTVELLRRLRAGEPVTVHLFPIAVGCAALLAGGLASDRNGTRRRETLEMRAQLAAAGGVAFVAVLVRRPGLSLVPAGLVVGAVVGAALIATAESHLIRNRLRPLISWLSISEPAAKESLLAPRRLLLLVGVLPGLLTGAVLALRQLTATTIPPWTEATLAGAVTALLAAGVFLIRARALAGRLLKALRGPYLLDGRLISDARRLLLATAPAAIVAAASILLTRAEWPLLLWLINAEWPWLAAVIGNSAAAWSGGLAGVVAVMVATHLVAFDVGDERRRREAQYVRRR